MQPNLIGKIAKVAGANALFGATACGIGDVISQKKQLKQLNHQKQELQKVIADLDKKRDEFTPVGKQANTKSYKCKTLLAKIEAKTKNGINLSSVAKNAAKGALWCGIFGTATDFLISKFRTPAVIIKN